MTKSEVLSFQIKVNNQGSCMIVSREVNNHLMSYLQGALLKSLQIF